MANWGFVLWLVGLSAITFFAVAWLLDFGNRQRQLQRKLDETIEQIERLRELERTAKDLPRCIQAAGLVLFRASAEDSDDSFALALANAKGDGAIISAVFAREGATVQAKPLSGWVSSLSLSPQEEEAVNQAQLQAL